MVEKCGGVERRGRNTKAQDGDEKEEEKKTSEEAKKWKKKRRKYENQILKLEGRKKKGLKKIER